ncbi:MAG TPA: F0F1 ATP synthase subunit B [Candidatus Saccharimonadales bacterium]|nr:F0F1 ATP synthase subunit B [Candidatus Saccharimonadales bacterium]
MEILNNFGFEPILFFAQIVNFLIILFVLKKFLYKPVLKLLKERRDKIAEGIKQAEEAAKILEQTLEKEEKILKDAQEKAKKLIAEAKLQTEDMLKKSEEQTKQRIDVMLKEARDQISYETGIAEKRLETNISKLAVAFLEKSLKGFFGQKEQEVLMKEAIKKLTTKSKN